MGSPASHGVPQPREGWQPCHGIGGSFAVESAAAFVWNRWQACYGISGNFRVERVAALPWNQWQNSPGIGGSFAVEYAGRLSKECKDLITWEWKRHGGGERV
jgi:hypothetical protein